MKNYVVGFDCGDGIFSVNMIWTNTGVEEFESVQDTANRRAEKYGRNVAYIREISQTEAESNMRKGMPYYSIDEQAEFDHDPSFAADRAAQQAAQQAEQQAAQQAAQQAEQQAAQQAEQQADGFAVIRHEADGSVTMCTKAYADRDVARCELDRIAGADFANYALYGIAQVVNSEIDYNGGLNTMGKAKAKVDYVQAARAALQQAMIDICAEKRSAMTISISDRNVKMGEIASVSLLPILTCDGSCCATCAHECYAKKMAIRYGAQSNTIKAWARNTAIYLRDPSVYFAQVRAAASTQRFFRYHVGGDIPNMRYLHWMVDTARALPNTEFLCFTKRHAWIAAWIDENGKLPQNLHVILSGWMGARPYNPHGLPETNTYARGDDLPHDWIACGGECAHCACAGMGCWRAMAGDVIGFRMH